ncbi:MAG TPA: hypothetical protein GYA05_03075 [Acholeplasmataceae bacterium]|jgi:hypothetical protein|nr:hypothetical protein [Acholeplasmataceae bacterium]
MNLCYIVVFPLDETAPRQFNRILQLHFPMVQITVGQSDSGKFVRFAC